MHGELISMTKEVAPRMTRSWNGKIQLDTLKQINSVQIMYRVHL